MKAQGILVGSPLGHLDATPRNLDDARRSAGRHWFARPRGNAISKQQQVILTDGTITLRPWKPDDWRAVLDACQDEQIARFVPIPLPYTEVAAHDFISKCEDEWATGHARPFAIADATTGEVVGAISRHAPSGHSAEFGYWVAPGARGRGVATRALRLIVDWTLATTDLVRLDLYTHPDNHASGRVALGAGFAREGVRRAWYLDRDGRPQDAVFYVLVRDT